MPYETHFTKLNIPGLDVIGSKAAIGALLDDIADGAYAYWIAQAKLVLNSTQVDYTDNLNFYGRMDGDWQSRVLALESPLANAIENGQDAYDMHDTLLGPNVPEAPIGQRGKHKKKDGQGYYRAIPFRHQTPGSNGIHGQAMGSAYEGHDAVPNAAKLGKDIYKAAKKLTPSTGQPGGKVKYGSRLPAGMAPKLRPHHKTDIYAGMIKQSKTYAKATQSSYATFRTISTGSPGWHRRATAGIHLAEKVQRYVEGGLAQSAIEAFLKGALGA